MKLKEYIDARIKEALNEVDTAKRGTTWKTKAGKIGAMNSTMETRYFDPAKDKEAEKKAKEFAKSSRHKPTTEPVKK